MSNFFTRLQIEKITNLALEAGKIAARSFEAKDFLVTKKADGSGVTSADIAVSKFLHKHLQNEFPLIPIICEEGELHEVSGEIFFLIDPIDGTSSFIKGDVEFCVNIALVKNKKPIFGLIYAPLFEGGKMAFSNENNQVMLRQTHHDNLCRRIDFTEVEASDSRLLIITSSRSKDRDVANCMAQICPKFSQNFTTKKLSSAIKFFRLLEGDADLYLHFRPSMEWDTAAGQALVEMLGGEVKKLTRESEIGENLTYKKTTFENSPFVAFISKNIRHLGKIETK
jgi:3'(2'), 5'-bisphosphate nucleotidase